MALVRSKWLWGGLVALVVLFWAVLSIQSPDKAIITPIAFFAALVANATAVGGGFLFFPLFVYFFGLAPEISLKLSLSTQAFGMTSGALGWSRQFIDLKALWVGAVFGALGVVLGIFFIKMPSTQIKPFFGWVSIVLFAVILAEIKLGQRAVQYRIRLKADVALLGLVAVSLLGGLVTAWAAIGAGEFIALYLLLAYRVHFNVAVATGVAVLASCSIVGFISHIRLGGIPWQYLVFTVPGVLLGGVTGARVGRNLNRWLKTYLAGKSTAGISAELMAEGVALKWVFSVVVLVDGISVLLNHYYFH